jgi:hypothetical protein
MVVVRLGSNRHEQVNVVKKLAQVMNCSFILLVLGFSFRQLQSGNPMGLQFATLEPLFLLIPFGAALAAISLKPRKWLFASALLANGLLAVLCMMVLLGELVWGMLGSRFISAVVLLALLPSIVNLISVPRVRSSVRQ